MYVTNDEFFRPDRNPPPGEPDILGAMVAVSVLNEQVSPLVRSILALAVELARQVLELGKVYPTVADALREAGGQVPTRAAVQAWVESFIGAVSAQMNHAERLFSNPNG